MHSLRPILLKTGKSICRLPVHDLRNNSTLGDSFIYIALYTCAKKTYSCSHVLLSDAESPTDIIRRLRICFFPCVTFASPSN